MKRREFVAALCGATVWPLVSRAQPTGKVYRIGILETVSAAQNGANLDGLRNGLRKLGYVEGQNLVLNTGRRGVTPSDSLISPPSSFV